MTVHAFMDDQSLQTHDSYEDLGWVAVGDVVELTNGKTSHHAAIPVRARPAGSLRCSILVQCLFPGPPIRDAGNGEVFPSSRIGW